MREYLRVAISGSIPADALSGRRSKVEKRGQLGTRLKKEGLALEDFTPVCC